MPAVANKANEIVKKKDERKMRLRSGRKILRDISNKTNEEANKKADNPDEKKKNARAASKSRGRERSTKVRRRSKNADVHEETSEPTKDVTDLNELDLSCNENYVYEADTKVKDNPLMSAEYLMDMYEHYKEAEERFRISPYMSHQRDINAKMRGILIDWLVEVHMKFKLAPATLHLMVYLVDKYCSQMPVARSRLQLVGVTALLIACKYEEIYPPEVRDCVYITDHAYTRDEVLEMETAMLDRLNFAITVPTANSFLVRDLHLINATPLTENFAQYFLERCLQEHDMLEFEPSLIAAASVFLALKKTKTGRKIWPAVLEEYTGYNEDRILPVAKKALAHAAAAPVTASRRELTAVKRKFTSTRYMGVSEIDLPTLN